MFRPFSFTAFTLFLLVGCSGGDPQVVVNANSGAGGTSKVANATSLEVPDAAQLEDANKPAPICGNGIVELGEICDDGNHNDGDGCRADCLAQDPEYRCAPGQSCEKVVICGNGRLEGNEACDDSNLVGGDGCSADCRTIEPGFDCSRPGAPCRALPVCGNGVRELGEQCDDAQTPPKGGDGCSATCQLESGYYCPTGAACIKLACGDGARTPDEECDDGNRTDGDGCSALCKKESGWTLTSSGVRPVCGDGIIRGSEECDDGNSVSGDGCGVTCKIEPLFSCTDQPSRCTSTIVCGDGRVEGGEICDPPGTNHCAADCKTFVMPGPVCGNGQWETGEGCDDGNLLLGDGCDSLCQVEVGYKCPQANECVKVPVCGNGVRELGEACDDANSVSGDGCTDCKIDSPDYYCPVAGQCVLKACGDGVRTRDEECDDGNKVNGDGCSSSCTTEPGWIITTQGAKPICGDGVRVGSELADGACDDHNRVSGDGCTSSCQVEPLMQCSGQPSACTSTIRCGDSLVQGTEVCDPPGVSYCAADCKSFLLPPSAVCGNGVWEGGEECEGGEGCDSQCKVKAGWKCPQTNRCYPLPVCGNGVREPGEHCDDSNSTGGDGCSSTCQLESGYACPPTGQCTKLLCGDGQRTPDEECDDGNTAGGDGCSSTCSRETGWIITTSGAKPVCGDGLIRPGEACDDGNNASGDGCSSICQVEPLMTCTTAEPSVCQSTVRCNDGRVDIGEVCDPPNATQPDGTKCAADCKTFVVASAVCGDGIWQNGEGCDDGNHRSGDGCSPTCTVESGWKCPQAKQCVKLPTCGDGSVNASLEECDDGNTVGGDGCSNDCQVETAAHWYCSGLAPSKCVHEVCGDGKRTPTEECDDGNSSSQDGCSSACKIEDGWACFNTCRQVDGGACATADKCIPKCGDGKRKGPETCDDGNKIAGDGCGANCRIEFGYTCPTEGAKCVPAKCGDGHWDVEAGEGCDDGNAIAGDGCGPTCQKEPTIIVPPAKPNDPTQPQSPDRKMSTACGDGLLTGTEKCDDGNTMSGDGCSSTCEVETGFTCKQELTLPTSIEMRVNLRDFKAGNARSGGGHPDFQYDTLKRTYGLAGEVCGGTGTCGTLDIDGKPTLLNARRETRATSGIKNADTYWLWFRDSNAKGVKDENGRNNIIVKAIPNKTLTLTQQGGTSSTTYVYDAAGSYFPITPTEGLGSIGGEVPICSDGIRNMVSTCVECDATCLSRDYSFTTELRYFFQYQGGEKLIFNGDDDVWVFVNGRLAVDLGGLHEAVEDSITLNASGTDTRFAISRGNVYEIALFHAERHTYASNFRLTLTGFLAPRSHCSPICGDAIVAGGEVCDDGANNSSSDTNAKSGQCNHSCSALAYCGDGSVQDGETCDNGANTDLYASANATGKCAPGCVAPAGCGDGIVQAAWEDCDLGSGNSNSTYGTDSCTTACKYGPYCGDGAQNGPAGEEDCDKGSDNGDYGDGSCTAACKNGPYCGDKVRNGPEDCDYADPAAKYCSPSCTSEPHCGDNIKQAGEDCDWGSLASTTYGTCNRWCKWNSHCGDGIIDPPYEECDKGAANDNDTYGGCRTDCLLGPRCGDAITQLGGGEQCDNGINADVYQFLPSSCAAGCKAPPSCGDGHVQSEYEYCDKGADNSDTAYKGCNTKCDLGPYCGDGVKNGTEDCDLGLANGGYGQTSCTVDCRNGPYCGDGVRNGTEECDGTPHCNPTTCKIDPYCGDNITQTGEECDWGASAKTTYGTCNASCRWNARCGDGHLDTPEEQCDEGASNNNDTYGGCRIDCLLGPRCGDGIRQPGEECDNGYNDDNYRLSGTACGPGCKAPGYCGDGHRDDLYELCDKGAANSDGVYGSCTTHCEWGSYCGDGIQQASAGEQCDLGLLNGGYGPGSCTVDCRPGPYCGDGIRNGTEDCDPADPIGSQFCSADCRQVPRCGDNVVQAGEQCDWGAAASSAYGACSTSCTWNAHCGDGVVQAPAEECDNGPANNNSLYGGCRTDCTFGPRCGDGITQAAAGEACDNGYNDDTYQVTSTSCGPGCRALPSCGDGVLQPLYEVCDRGVANSDTAYDGCTTKCTWGPYCGDGKVDPGEACDHGSANTPYSTAAGACGYDCQPAPYCGDGIRNGTEECDLGAAQNTGAYGGCSPSCKRAPYCGDHVIQTESGETCDDGPTGSTTCSPLCSWRAVN